MENKKLIVIFLVISVLLNIALGVWGFISVINFKNAKNQIIAQRANQKVLFFAKMFVDKFLLSSGTVDFDNRLALENAVREINDPEIYKQWQDFTKSPDNSFAQLSAGQLLKLLFLRLEQ